MRRLTRVAEVVTVVAAGAGWVRMPPGMGVAWGGEGGPAASCCSSVVLQVQVQVQVPYIQPQYDLKYFTSQSIMFNCRSLPGSVLLLLFLLYQLLSRLQVFEGDTLQVQVQVQV